VPSSVTAVFAAAGVAQAGVVPWGEPIPERGLGVYVVALAHDADSIAKRRTICPLSMPAVKELLRVRPELRVDGARPSPVQLATRLSALWLPNEVVVYIGLAGKSLQSRVSAYYRTPLGARRPHAGGWPLKTLQRLSELWVHFASCQDPATAEHRMLERFQTGVSADERPLLHDPTMPIPFANLEWAKGQRQRHGITGAIEPRASTSRTGVAASVAEERAVPARNDPAIPWDRYQRPVATMAGGMRSQRVTEKDIQAGRLRFPSSAKSVFPPDRGQVAVELRGHELTARWHPHYDRDQERSGVLSVGRRPLPATVTPDEVLSRDDETENPEAPGEESDAPDTTTSLDDHDEPATAEWAIEDLADLVVEHDTRSRVYVIDEPEQHLHPALERLAATWMTKFAARPATQVVVATHSPRFLRARGNVVWNFIEPNAGHRADHDPGGLSPSRIATFRPHEKDALSDVARIMGFDRGELLLGASLILFVEGDSDMRVLNELFGPELHGAGVAMFPIHGVVDAEQKGLANAEILVRYTTANTALLVDNARRDDAQRLLDDPDFRREKMRSRARRDTELRAMARVVDAACRLKRRLVPLSIPVADIFDLLDETLIKNRFGGFPGHAEARAAAAFAAESWKDLYATKFGIDVLKDDWIFEQVAREMRRRQHIPDPTLMTLLDDILAAVPPR
jgi:hypothetical protein